MKLKSNLILKGYLVITVLSILLVFSFAFIQYRLVQKQEFVLYDYIIPLVVGGIFGLLISRIRILQIKYKAEKETVLDQNRKIHSYIGTIVHDLRSPVSAISGLTKILLEEDEKKDPRKTKFLTLIYTSSESILENIALILENTKLEKGIGPEHIETGNPYFTINSTIDKHVVLAVQKSISIQRMIDKNLPAVQYDKSVLDRVVSNIISNAIKYSPYQTQIKIFTELFSDRLELVVSDEGQGLTKDDLSNLFNEFQTLSAKPTGGEASSGLGLFVTKKLIQQIGGEIVAESDGTNKGSTFRVSLKLS